MSEVILVGVDGSEGARRAMSFAVSRAEMSGEKLVLVHVVDWSPYSMHTPTENERRSLDKKKEIERAQNDILAPLLAQAEGKQVTIESEVRHGHPAEVLSAAAEDHQAALIIIGRRGRSRFRTLLFGSVASNLVQIAPVPVTVVP